MKKIYLQKLSLIISDIFALFVSLLIANYLVNFIRPGDHYTNFVSFGIAKLFGLLVIVVFWYQEQYSKRRPIWEELHLLYQTVFIFAILHLGITYLFSHHVIKLLNVLFWPLLMVVLPSCRAITKTILSYFKLWHRNIYIIGVEANAIATYDLLLENKILGYKVHGFINLSNISKLENIKNTQVLSYDELLAKKGLEPDTEIIFALSTNDLIQNMNKINWLQSKFKFVSIVPDISGIPLYGVELDHFFGSDQLFLRLQNNLESRFNRLIKRLIDITLSSIGVIVLSPIMLIIALGIKLTTKCNVFFLHRRIGQDGREFSCMKFQTMRPDSNIILEEILANDPEARLSWEKDFKLKNDPRITLIGKFLRNTSLDELPQLFNVLIGDMSLVGPRPIVKKEIERYRDDFYYYKLVRPGISGLWQISGRSDLDYEKRVRLDVWYVKNWSLWYDFVILLKTILVVIKRNGAY